ncbi:MAG: GTP cyclohydrolase I FolE2 [Fimbriimonadaceae bacterium]|nr:GTP cyclohydrolase I FolE2 [Fimbriimonadaceae bacterium]QYK56357.1 MAG: GTP cyclohydrolase I FolE2 [Fimbriimonadaceae bacterium]
METPETTHVTDGTLLPDIQKTKDTRNIPIDKVGVRGVKYPITVLDRDNGEQQTIGDFTLTVDLPSEFKGTHMSRFLEVLNQTGRQVSVHSLPEMLHQMTSRLHARQAHVAIRFPFFMVKRAPVTGAEGMMQFECGFDAEGNGEFESKLFVRVPVTTLCPCSKEISSAGAHNQRGWVTAKVVPNGHIWLEELIEMIEASASCALFPVLKRPDEKWVTETAYQNPRFVEDMVREVALRFDSDDRILRYEVEVENEESIHAHNAYAYLARSK